MKNLKRICAFTALVVATLSSIGAQASLILDQTVTYSFNDDIRRVSTAGNDFPGIPNWLHLGQLRATAPGYVDFFYVGHEAAYTNSFLLGGSSVHSTHTAPDNFYAPYAPLPSLAVVAGELLDFGFCTSGGADIGYWDRCAHNDSDASLVAQFNYQNSRGYRSIAFRPLTSFSTQSVDQIAFRPLGNKISDLWMLFWDDSGAQNDDNHDDHVVVASFRRNSVPVPEPATALLLATGVLLISCAHRRKGMKR